MGLPLRERLSTPFELIVAERPTPLGVIKEAEEILEQSRPVLQQARIMLLRALWEKHEKRESVFTRSAYRMGLNLEKEISIYIVDAKISKTPNFISPEFSFKIDLNVPEAEERAAEHITIAAAEIGIPEEFALKFIQKRFKRSKRIQQKHLDELKAKFTSQTSLTMAGKL